MATKPEWLDKLVGEATTILRNSDTFDWLTTKAADELSARSTERSGTIAAMRSTIADRGPDRAKAGAEFDAVVRFATAEAAAQKKVAAWLQSKAPKRGDGAQ